MARWLNQNIFWESEKGRRQELFWESEEKQASKIILWIWKTSHFYQKNYLYTVAWKSETSLNQVFNSRWLSDVWWWHQQDKGKLPLEPSNIFYNFNSHRVLDKIEFCKWLLYSCIFVLLCTGCWKMIHIYLGQHWLRQWFIAWWHKAITWTNIDCSFVGFCGIYLRAISQQTRELLFPAISLRIITLKLL